MRNYLSLRHESANVSRTVHYLRAQLVHVVPIMQQSNVYQPRIPARTSRHAIRGIDYSVREWGDPAAPVLIYLHGWADTAATFQFVVDELCSDWRVIAPDWRGFGDSHGPVASYWFADYLADLDLLLDLYSPDAAVPLAGHSMGANVAGLYAGVMPERVSAFINMEGFGLPDSKPAEAPERYRQWLAAGRKSSAFSRYPDFAALAARIASRNPRLSPAKAEFVAHCWGVQQGTELNLRADPLHKLPNPVLYRRAEAEACWRKVQAPVLLVAGSDSDIARRLGGSIDAGLDSLPFPDASRVVLDDAGHMLHFDAPAALADTISGFLAKTL